MSPATIDRRLQGAKVLAAFTGRSHTKPGSLLKSQIPIRTWSEWDDDRPGFVEIDLVGHEGHEGHEGHNSFGEFCFTLTVTDIATGWTINRSVVNQAAIHVVAALDDALAQFPFPILGIDSDNGSEFINAHLFEYCLARTITFTRSRPGNKNDGAHVEQKNWTHVRSLVGYLRYDTPAELKILNEIWVLDQRFTNLVCAQQKLISRERVGAKVIKRHDPAQTPHQRAIAAGLVSLANKAALTRALNRIYPGELQRQIDTLAARLERIALTKTTTPPRRRFSVRQRINVPGGFHVRQQAAPDYGTGAAGIVARLSDAERLTLAVLQSLLGYSDEARFVRYAHAHLGGLFPYIPERPAYNKRLRRSVEMAQGVMRALAQRCTAWHDDVWLIDSTPVECGRSRETTKRSDLAGTAGYGYCASHSRYFWGLRLHLIATPAGLLIAYALTNPKDDERATPTRTAFLAPTPPDHRVDQPDTQSPTRPRTTRRTQPRRSRRPRHATPPRPHRSHLAQRTQPDPTTPITHRLRPLNPTEGLERTI